MNIKGYSAEVSNGNEDYVIKNCRKANAYYKVAKIKKKKKENFAELCPCSCVLWKVEPVRNEIRYLVEEISKQSGGEVAWFFPSVYDTM